MQRSTWMVGAAALGICIGGTALAADKAGWAVRICRGQTEASAMKITVGDGKKQKELVNWQSDSKATDFAVPAPLATAKKLTVTVDSEPPDGRVVTCVMYNHAPAKTMKFNDLLSVTVAKSDKDDTCPCK
jgi:hypothetical protein